MSERVRVNVNERRDAGRTAIDDLSADSALGVAKSVIGFDTRTRQFGVLGGRGLSYELTSTDEMSYYVIAKHSHKMLSEFGRPVGDCADFSMAGLVDRDDAVLILFVQSGGDTFTAAALADLASWGLFNDGSTALRTLGAGDLLSFVGMKGLSEQGVAHEIRVTTSEEMVTAVQLIDSVLVH